MVTPHSVAGRSLPVLCTPYDALTPSGDAVLAPDHAAFAMNALLAEARQRLPDHLGIDFRAVRQSSVLWAALRTGVDGYVIARFLPEVFVP